MKEFFKGFLSPTLIVGGLILLTYGSVAIYSTLNLQEASRNREVAEIGSNFYAHGEYIQGIFERAMTEARTLGGIGLNVHQQGIGSRSTLNEILKQNAWQNKEFLGYWMVWEPDAFDGLDAQKINTPGSNEAGRYVPYWHWLKDSVVLENCVEFDESDYYLLPKFNQREYLLEPFYYPVSGQDSLLVSVVVPIVENNEFLGVSGIDISLNSLKILVSKVSEIEGGHSRLVSGEGTVVLESGIFDGHSHNTTYEANDTIIWCENEVMYVAGLGRDYSDKPWSLQLSIPISTLNDDFLSVGSNLLLVSGISALIILLLLFFNASQKRADEVEKQRVKSELSATDARMRAFTEGQSMFYTYSLDRDLRFTGFNSQFQKFAKEQFKVDVSIGQLVPEIKRAQADDSVLNYFENVLKGNQVSTTSLLHGRYYTRNFSPIYDDQSKVIGLTCTIFEVTDKIKAEQELEKYQDRLEFLVEERTRELSKQKEFLQQLVDQIPALIFVLDKEGKHVLINSHSAEYFGYSMQEVLGKSINDVHGRSKQSKQFLKEDKEVLEKGTTFRSEMLSTESDGSQKWMLFTKSRMYVDGDPYVLGIYVDINHLKETELELKNTNEELKSTLERLQNTQLQLIEAEKMASLGSLTAGLAHEINNPMNYVAGNVQPIREDLAEIRNVVESMEDAKSADVMSTFTEVNALLDGIQDGTGRVIELIKDLTEFSSPIEKKNNGEVNINACIRATVNLVRHQPNKQIKFDLALGEVPMIDGNEAQLKQVFLNLFTNACQAIDKSGTVRIKTSVQDGNLIIRVADTGHGIKPEHVRRVFEPFFTTKDVGQGTGLGLAISYNIIKESGGHIDLVETSYQGTTFEVVFPLKASSGKSK